MKYDGYAVYVHKSPDGKVYVGATSSAKPETRWGSDGNGYSYNTRFTDDIRKYGWSNFEHIIVSSNLSREDALELERSLIYKFDSINPEHGYNMFVKGGPSCLTDDGKKRLQQASRQRKRRKWTEEERKRLSLSKRGVKLGPCSEATKQKISAANKGKCRMTESQREHIIAARKLHPNKLSAETRSRMSDIMKAKYSDPHIRSQLSARMKGKNYLTDEGRARLRERFTLYTVKQVSAETNEIINVFESFREAANHCIQSGIYDASLGATRDKLYGLAKSSKPEHGYIWIRELKQR